MRKIAYLPLPGCVAFVEEGKGAGIKALAVMTSGVDSTGRNTAVRAAAWTGALQRMQAFVKEGVTRRRPGELAPYSSSGKK